MSAETTSPSPPVLLRLLEELDLRVFVPALLLTGAGLVSLASADPDRVGAQVSGIVVGVAAAIALVLLPYRTVLRLAWPAWILSLLLLLAVFIPGVGTRVNGATRWIRLGDVQIQPSEFAKAAQVLLLARFVRFRRDHRTFRGLAMPFLLTFIPAALIVAEPDLGSALLLVPTLFVMLWVAGAQARHLLAVVAMGVASLPAVYPILRPYQQRRVQTFVTGVAEGVGLPSPWKSADAAAGLSADEARRARIAAAQRDRDARHQTERAELAVASGGLFGQGWGEGPMNVRNKVPEKGTDFIFVVHAEEWGFVGVAGLVALYGLLFFGLASLAAESREPAARLVCVGVLVSVAFQTSVNLLMTLQLAPVTGVPLPFLSYGRSSMLSVWILCGLALHVRAREPRVFTRADFD